MVIEGFRNAERGARVYGQGGNMGLCDTILHEARQHDLADIKHVERGNDLPET
jgi:hypothetical protein